MKKHDHTVCDGQYKMVVLGLFVLSIACSDEAKCNLEQDSCVQSEVKDYIAQNLNELVIESGALQNALPEPDDDGWSMENDQEAINQARTYWKRMRIAYERVEGAIAVLFPELDASTDERYDGFVESQKDNNLFDGEGVTGVHAVERILWSNQVPPKATAFEVSLGDRYLTPRFPQNKAEASLIKTGLVQRLMDDLKKMSQDFEPLALDNAAAFRGVIGSMEEQLEKTTLAATGQEESRYANSTLADMRANLEGGLTIYKFFRSKLLASDSNAGSLDTKIQEAFQRVQSIYGSVESESLPEPPDSFSAINPSEKDLSTPFGKIFLRVRDESDSKNPEGLVGLLLKAAELMKIPTLPG